MWCRRGSRIGASKIRKPELSPMSREHKEKQKRIVDSLSPPPSATNPVVKTEEEPTISLPTQRNADSPNPPKMKEDSSSSPLPASSSPIPPPLLPAPSDQAPAKIVQTVARTWVGSFEHGVRQIKSLLVKRKNQSKTLTPEKEAEYIDIIKSFLLYLEYEVEITPALRDMFHFDQVLALPENEDLRPTAPPEIAAECRRLLEKFNEERWGEDDSELGQPAGHLHTEDASVNTGLASPRRSPSNEPTTAQMRLPAPEHPIWGLKGIMHGLVLKPGTRGRVYGIDPRYVKKIRTAKVIGHNGFEPGMWWPYQRLAHFYGAHGSHQAGITGDPKLGCFSIVTKGSSSYNSMDQDFGEKLLYSADNSQNNTDPNKIVHTTNLTRSLHKSIETGQPVRVLRSSGGKKAYTPKVGIRYDGLYRVTAVHRVKNDKGGLYEQFELHRLSGQRSLDDIHRNVPSKKQQDDYVKAKDGY